MSKAIVLIISTLLFSGCNTTKQIEADEFIIEFEKRPCSGSCPAYVLQIAKNGVAVLNGKENIDNIGKYKSQIKKQELEQLLFQFENMHFFELKDSYKSLFMDLQTKHISYTKNGKTKKIVAYDKYPEALKTLMNELDELVLNLNWTEIK